LELVYLWVEDYKNIKKQGFNFSPRFECKYENDELTIIEKKEDEYINNFFGKNINVTAIVGKNGSGKSSLIKLIYMLIYYHIFKDLDKSDKFMSHYYQRHFNRKKRIEKKYKNKIFLIINDNGTLKKITIGSGIIAHTIPIVEKISFYSIYFNYMIDTLNDKEDNWINEIYHKSDNYSIPLLLEPKKYFSDNIMDYQDNRIINIDLIEYLLTYKTLKLFNTLDGNITTFFNPNKIVLVNNRCATYSYLDTSSIPNFSYKIITNMDKIEGDVINDGISSFLISLEESEDYKNINLFYIATKIASIIDKIKKSELENNLFQDETYKFIQENLVEYNPDTTDWDELFFNIIEFVEQHIDNIFINDVTSYQTYKIRQSILFYKEKIYEDEIFQSFLTNKEIKINEIKRDINTFIPPWLVIEFYENDKSIDTLSGGEKSLFRVLMDISYQVYNLSSTEYSTINIFLDETEFGLHPNWQKKYINNLIFTINKVSEKKIELFLLTHSPFLLSDIPKQNIIFLDKEKDGSSKVLNHEEVLIKKQTFGANIHTLLSDSFFMDGLMGEFAKNKIQEIMDFLNNIKTIEEISTKEEQIKQVIESIGEPFLRRKLLDMYYSHPKYQDESLKEARKKELEAQKRQIEEELKRL